MSRSILTRTFIEIGFLAVAIAITAASYLFLAPLAILHAFPIAVLFILDHAVFGGALMESPFFIIADFFATTVEIYLAICALRYALRETHPRTV